MLITLRLTAICKSFAEIYLTGMGLLGAVSHIFYFLMTNQNTSFFEEKYCETYYMKH